MAVVRDFRARLTEVFSYTRVRAGRLRVGMTLGLVGLVALTAIAFGVWVKPATATAAAANTVNFQARLETASGSIAQDGNYNVRFKLYNVSTGGSALWTETYLVSASQGIRTANGYLTANLGTLTAFPSTINWGQQIYLTMEIGGTGSSPTWDGEMSPRLSLTSVPSAFALNSYNGANGFSSSLSILQPTGGNQTFQIQDQGAAGTYNLCIAGSTSCGFAPTTGGSGYIQNQSASAQASSNFWISGTGKAATALQAPSFDSIAAGNLNIGTTNATSITLGKTGVNTIVAGNLSVGTTSSYGAITIANGAWLTALDSAGTGYVNMLSVNTNNEIQVGAALNIDGGIVLPTDGGQMTLSDLPISSSALAGTAQSYTLRVGSTNALTVYGEADGAGNAQNVRVAIGSSITPAYTLDVGGDINTSGTFRINGTAICTTAGCSAASGSGNYIQNTTTQQASSNFYISGTGRATTSLLTPTLDTIAAGSLAIGTSTATSITIAKTGVATTVAGALNVTGNTTATGLVTANGGLTVVGLTQLYASTATNNVSGSGTNWLRAPKNTVSAFIGNNDGTSGYTADEFSGNLRFNGSGVAWGDFGYYPQGGGNGSAGQFRFSTAGAAVSTTPNAKVGVGSLYSAGAIGIGTLSPGFSLDVQGGNINTSGALYTAGAIRISSTGAGTLSTLSLTGVLTSTVATGTAPLTVASTTVVTNLNADKLDGYDASDFCIGSCVAGGGASGDLTGNYPNPTIAKLQGSTLTITTPVSGNILQFNGTAWVNQAVTGDISIAGTGVASITAGSIVNADLASGSFTNITGVGTLGSLSVTNDVSIISGGLVVNGTTVLTNGRTLQSVTYQGGTIAVGYGGTGQTSFTQHGVLFGNNTGSIGVTAAGTTGQCLVSTTGSAPAWGSCAGAGSGVTLQSAYNNSLGGTNPEIVLDSSRTTLDIQAYSGQTADLLDLRAYAASGLGVLRFGVTAGGAVTSAGSLTVQSGGASITGGINNNSGNITNTGSLTGVTGITTTGGYTQSGTTANTLTGATTISNTLTVSNTATFNGNLVVSTGTITQGGYLAADAATDNLVVNGDFERNNTTGWTGITDVVTGGYAGNYAGRIVGPQTVESADFIPVDPTRDVLQLEAYIKKSVAGTTPGTLYFGYKAYNASKTVITTAPCGTYCYFAAAGAVVAVDGNWHKYSATTTGEGTAFPNFPVGTKYVRILGLINYTGSADTETLVDHISARRINNGALFVGNNYSSTNLVDQYQQSQLYTTTSGVLTVATQSNADVNILNGGLQLGGTSVITSGRAIQNVTGLTVTGSQGNAALAATGSQLTFSRATANYIQAVTAGGYLNFVVNGATANDGNAALTLTAANNVLIPNGSLSVGGQVVFNSSGILQSAAVSGAYTGITGVGTLTSLTTSGVITSTVATGTAPFTVASTTKVTNLNADLLDGLDSTAFCQGSCLATGSAGGDLTGSYPNPTIAKLQGSTLTLNTPASGNILQFNGTAWVNQSVTGDITISSTGVAAIGAGVIVNADLSSGAYSNITGTGALTSGSIGSGFGTISTANTITTTSTVTGSTINGTTGIQINGSTLATAVGNYNALWSRNSSGGLRVYNAAGNTALLEVSDAGNVSLAGSLSSRQNNVRTYQNVYSWGTTTTSVTGTLEIILPNAWNNSMLRFQISGYDFSTNAAWSAIVSGYNYSATPVWMNTSAELRGAPAPFSSIRLAYDSVAGKTVLLLGTTSTTWAYPQFSITEVMAGFGNQDAWGSGYSSAFLTSEANITNINTPTTQQVVYGQAFLQGGNSFATGAILGTNDNNALTFETNNVNRLSVDTSGNVNLLTGALQVGGTTVISSGRVLQNVTYNGGTIAVGYGGTGQTSFTQYGVLFGNGTNALGTTAAGATGQCLVASTGGAPTWSTCAGAGSGVTLQSAYNNSLGGTNPEIVLDSSRTTLDVQAYSGQTADLLDLRAYSASGLGVLRFGVSAGGAVTAAGALTVQSGGASITGAVSSTSTITGTTLNGTTGVNTGAGAGSQRIDASGNLTSIGTYSGSGNITTTGGVLTVQGTGTNSFAGNLTVAGTTTVSSLGFGTAQYSGTDFSTASTPRTIFFNMPTGPNNPERYYKIARIKLTGAYHSASLTGYIMIGDHEGREDRTDFDFRAFASTTPGTPQVMYTKRGNTSDRVLVYSIQDGGGTDTMYYDIYLKQKWFNVGYGELTLTTYSGAAVTLWQAGLDSGTTAPTDTLVETNGAYNFDVAKVGIGTMAPGALLTVSTALTTNLTPIATFNTTGTKPVLIGNGTSNTGVMLGYGGNDIQARTGTNFATNGDLKLNPYGGNVGVGTATPGYKLDVQGGDINTSGNLRIGGAVAMAQSGGFLRINESSAQVNGVWLGSSALRAAYGGVYLGSAGGDGQIALLTSGGDNTRRITLSGNTGNVAAISFTQNSNAVCDISGNCGVAAGSNNYIQNTTTVQAGANFNIGANGVIGGTLNVAGDILGNSKIAIRTNDTWLRLNPTNAFTAGIYANTGIFRTDGTLQVGNNGGTLNVVSGGNFAYNTNTLFANTAGNVGIGTTTPGAKLEVAGNTLVTTTNTAALKLQNASSSVLFNADTNNMRLSIGNAAGSAARLHVEGSLAAWTARTGVAGGTWNAVTYGNGQFVAVAYSGTNQVMTSPDGITWTGRTAAQANDWRSVTYGAGLYVAVAFNGTNQVMTSPDGITWTARTAAEANGWQSVTYGNGIFVAVSRTGTNRVMTSPDGITWTARTAAEANTWRSVTYGNGQFVAVASDGTNRVMTSPDGITWTARTAAEATTWSGVTYGNGQFVAVADSGTNRVMTSPDGITWTARTAAEANQWNTIGYGNGLYVAVALNGVHQVMTSPDGITWTIATATASTYWTGVAYGNNQFTAVGDGNRVMTSPGYSEVAERVNGSVEVNGGIRVSGDAAMYGKTQLNGETTVKTTSTTTFSIQNSASSTLFNADTLNMRLSIGNSAGSAARLHVEGSMAPWTAHAAAEANSWNAATYGNGLFVAVASTGTNRVMTSPDGITWTARTAAEANNWVSVTYGNGLFVAVASTGTNRVMTSPDGITWTARTAAAANWWHAVTYGNGLFVAVSYDGTNRVMTSPDGITWTARTAAEANSWNAVTYGNGLFVAVSYDGTNRVMTSPDGITWTAHAAAAANAWQSVTYGNGLFVAVSWEGPVMTSPDGITWTITGTPTAGGMYSWNSVTYGNGLFVAVSGNMETTDAIATSPDGITWTDRTAPEIIDGWNSVTYGNGLFVAVAAAGTHQVMTSPGYSEVAQRVNGNVEINGGSTLNGSTTIKDTSMQAFQVQGGNGMLLNVDTINMQVGIKNGGTLVIGNAPIVNVTTSSATFSYNTPIPSTATYSVPNSNGNNAVATADLDGDGDQDMVIGSRGPWDGSAYPGILTLFKNSGDGSYGGAITLETITGDSAIYDVAIDDVDGDGDKDLVTYRSYYISVYKNNGNATFAAKVDYYASVSSGTVALGDVDGDGDKDIVASRGTGNWTYVLKNNGTGTFTTGSNVTTAIDVALADIDADGDLDTIAAAGSSGVTVSKNSSGGNTWTNTTYASPQSSVGVYAITVADVDNDGDKDVAAVGYYTSSPFTGYLFIYKNNGTGTLAAGVSYAAITQAGWVTAGDIDGDSDQDIIVSGGGGQPMIFKNTGATSFTGSTQTVTASIPILSDVDADGDLDLVGAEASVTKNNGAGAFGGSYNAGQEKGMAEADLNADGKMDIITRDNFGFVVHLGSANKTFTETAYTQAVSSTYGPLPRAVVGDIDGDGDKDIVLSEYTSGTNVYIYKNNGAGSFTASGSLTMTTYVRGIALADYDGDGDLDIAAVGSGGSNVISLSLNNGTGTYATPTSGATISANAENVVAADFDNDGDQDLAIRYETSPSIQVYSNNGSGGFTLVAAYAGSGNITGNLVAADIDNDGDKDVITASASNLLVVFPNNGNATFSFAQTYATGTSSSTAWLSAKDVDGDGDLDVAVGVNAGTVIHKNSGGGNLAVKTLYPVGTGATLTGIGDFDGDGDQDVASSTTGIGGGGKVLWNNNNAAVISSASSMISVKTKSATDGGLYIQGSASQSAYLFVIQDASGAALLTVDGQGNLSAKGAVLGGVGSPDYAENISVSDSTIEAADVVAMDPNNKESVIKGSKPYDETAIGVISTSPGFVTNSAKPGETDASQRPLALSGRVPVKITNENGVIAEGDYLTTSSTPGYAMKATKEGHVIGRAMGTFTGTEDDATDCGASYACGKVLMFIDNSYYSPVDGNNLQANDMTLFGNLGIGGNAVIGGGLSVAQDLNVGGLATLDTLKVTGNAQVGGNLTVAGTATVATLKVGKHLISESDAPLVAIGSAAGQDGLVTIDGTDVAGTLSITVKARPQQGNTPAETLNAGSLADVTFLSPYEFTPRIVISPTNQTSVGAPVYLVKTATGWQLMTSQPAADGTQYQFDYVIIGSQGQTAAAGN